MFYSRGMVKDGHKKLKVEVNNVKIVKDVVFRGKS